MSLTVGRIEQLVAEENNRLIQLANQKGDAEARLQTADEVVKLREEVERLRAKLSPTPEARHE